MPSFRNSYHHNPRIHDFSPVRIRTLINIVHSIPELKRDPPPTVLTLDDTRNYYSCDEEELFSLARRIFHRHFAYLDADAIPSKEYLSPVAVTSVPESPKVVVGSFYEFNRLRHVLKNPSSSSLFHF